MEVEEENGEQIEAEILAQTVEALEKRFNDALGSIGEIVSAENLVFDLHATLQDKEDPVALAEKTKKLFLAKMRELMEGVIVKIAEHQQSTWIAVRNAFPDGFPPEPGAKPQSGSHEFRSEFEKCPPGFVEENGICVQI
jgi:hypothetical protein